MKRVRHEPADVVGVSSEPRAMSLEPSVFRRNLVLLLWSVSVLGFTWLDPAVRKNKEGNRAYEQADYPGALESFQEAQVQQPDSPELHYNIGASYYQQEQYEEALKEFELALLSSDPALQSDIYYNIGNTRFRLGQHQEALEAYQRSLDARPDDIDAKYNIELIRQLLQQQSDSQSEESAPTEEQQESAGEGQGAPEEEGEASESDQGASAESQEDAQQEQPSPQKEEQEDQEQESTGQDSEQEQGGSSDSEEQPSEEEPDPAGTVESGRGHEEMSEEDALRILESIGAQEANQIERVHEAPPSMGRQVEKPW